MTEVTNKMVDAAWKVFCGAADGGMRTAIRAAIDAREPNTERLAKELNFVKELRRLARDWDGEPDDLDAVLTDAADAITRLVESLKQLVRDYQDIPDPSDEDGQAVFEEARKALVSVGAKLD